MDSRNERGRDGTDPTYIIPRTLCLTRHFSESHELPETHCPGFDQKEHDAEVRATSDESSERHQESDKLGQNGKE